MGNASEGINTEKYYRFKKLKFKDLKKRKEKKKNRRRMKKGETKENSIELLKPNVEAEVYNNNRTSE